MDEALVSMERWNRSGRDGRGDRQEGGHDGRKPTRILEKKNFPSWLVTSSPLSTDEKGSALRWFRRWFPARRAATGAQLSNLHRILSKRKLEEDELAVLKQTRREVAARSEHTEERGNRRGVG